LKSDALNKHGDDLPGFPPEAGPHQASDLIVVTPHRPGSIPDPEAFRPPPP
jgi:hypothetical protein